CINVKKFGPTSTLTFLFIRESLSFRDSVFLCALYLNLVFDFHASVSASHCL
ncbi:hypothetical protein BgiBS90_020746, partial [Biomphalaria glabrata]